jgi:hypothetical protein
MKNTDIDREICSENYTYRDRETYKDVFIWDQIE